MHVANQPAPGHITHDVFDRLEGFGRIGLVVHRQENAGEDLEHQDQRGQCTEEIEKVENAQKEYDEELKSKQG